MNAKDRLERLTAEARQRSLRSREEREERHQAPATVGDVFRFDETAHLGVLWALVAVLPPPRSPQGDVDTTGGGFLAVAADLCPLVASPDVAVPPDGEGGVLSLRCGVEIRLDAADLDGASWSGELDDGVLAAVRRKRAEIASGEVEGGLFARETDVDAEYHDWMEDGPEKARVLMSQERPAKVLRFQPRGGDRFFGVSASLAASVLLAVSLGLLAGLVWQGRELGRHEDPAQVNLPFAHFGTGQVRDAAVTLRVPSSAASFLLLVETDAAYEAYRLEICGKDDGVVVWASEELRPTGERASRLEPIVLSVLLPRRLFADGEYRVRLAGLRGGGAEEIWEAVLRLRVEGP